MGGYSPEELALKYLTAPAELNNFFKKIADALGMNFFYPQLWAFCQLKTRVGLHELQMTWKTTKSSILNGPIILSIQSKSMRPPDYFMQPITFLK